MAWLLGLQIGDNKKAGDLSAYVDYRQIGIAAVDPNLSFDDAMIARAKESVKQLDFLFVSAASKGLHSS